MNFSSMSNKKYPTIFRSASNPGFYVPGVGTFERRPNVYMTPDGEKVVQSAGVLRKTDGSLHQAYAAQPGTYISSIIEKQKRGFPLTETEQYALRRFYASNPTAGLPSVNDLGGGATKTALQNAKKHYSDSFGEVVRKK